MTDVENVVPTATYSDYELAIGAATSEAAGSVSTEIVIGILTGGASRYGRVGQGIAIVDAASNVGSGIAAGIDIAENGANTSNLLQLGGSLAGATAQVAGRTRFGGPKHADVPSAKAPKVSSGASLDNLTSAQQKQIQEFANREGLPVTVTGSRASGTSKSTGKPFTHDSDFDYVLGEGANAKTRKHARRYLPSGRAGGEIRGTRESGQDFFKHVEEGAESITFFPQGS